MIILLWFLILIDFDVNWVECGESMHWPDLMKNIVIIYIIVHFIYVLEFIVNVWNIHNICIKNIIKLIISVNDLLKEHQI